MCGIFAYLGIKYSIEDLDYKKIHPRGPDSLITTKVSENLSFTFARLMINDLTETGHQPMIHPEDDNLFLMCNGEIYNHKGLEKDYKFNMKSTSDCEVILHLYKHYKESHQDLTSDLISQMIQEFDGVFSFLLFDKDTQQLIIARDPFGVRPLFYGYTEDNELLFSSEIKAIQKVSERVERFPPGKFTIITTELKDDILDVGSLEFHKWFKYDFKPQEIKSYTSEDIEEFLEKIRDLLTKATKKRLMSDRPVGCLLSGGLDSSLISALACQLVTDHKLQTFSIGLKGSPDLKYAKMVAEYIGSDHHSVEVTEEDLLDAIPDVIEAIESYDITTVRASTPNYLIAKFISENTDVRTVFSGEGADEVCPGYLYLGNAPYNKKFSEECLKLIKELVYFDVLRADRCLAAHGLDGRFPFLDPEFVRYYQSIPVEFRTYGNLLKKKGIDRIEKNLLRKAFDSRKVLNLDETYETIPSLLPEEVLWRKKDAFSDAVSKKKRSWHKIIQEKVDSEIADEEFEENRFAFTFNTPETKEAYYYRKIFEQFYTNHGNVIDHFWLPPEEFLTEEQKGLKDPSARELTE